MPKDAPLAESSHGTVTVPSACPHDCPSACALDVERLDARTIGRVRGRAGHPYTDGVVCAKVARYAERTHHPDRLTTPLRRVGGKGPGEGTFEPVSWDDALDLVAERFTLAAQRHGAEAVWPYYFSGTMGLVQRDGIKRLTHVLGYSRMLKSICSLPARHGWLAGVGAYHGADSREMAEADLIVLWGMNPAATQVHVMTHATRARKERGTRIVCIDPYRTATAAAADIHLAPRPGTDGALACAVMHVLFAEGFADWDYLRAHTDVPERLQQHLTTRTPQWAAEITGLDADAITQFARLYGRTQRAFLRVGYGFTRSRNGAAAMHAVSCLPAVTGAWRHRGGGALFSNFGVYAIDMTLIEGLDALDDSTRILDISRVGEVLMGERAALGDGPPVTAMLIQNTNPCAVTPDLNKVHRGFARDDLFVCVHEQFMTETAQRADVVLPATTFMEHDELLPGGGHSFLQVSRAIIEPVGQARCNHDVLNDLARRLGAAHPGFDMTAWEVLEETLRRSGLPDGETIYAAGGLDLAPPFAGAHFLDGFGHPDGRFRFAPDWAAEGPDGAAMPPLPDHMAVIEEATAEHPFRLVTAPAHNYLNSSFTETPTSQKKEGRPTVFLHPDDAADLGIGDGGLARLGNGRGTVLLHAQLRPGSQRGVVVVESIWPNAAFMEGIGVNALTGSDPVPPGGGAAFHDSAVWVRPE
ncbi:MAG: molybdopterin oxidoreductase family protein [Hyphomicrobiales bacterium]|nr:molybdopterin oxidoreductase family protein [Hyphomicrobiales bacterium]